MEPNKGRRSLVARQGSRARKYIYTQSYSFQKKNSTSPNLNPQFYNSISLNFHSAMKIMNVRDEWLNDYLQMIIFLGLTKTFIFYFELQNIIAKLKP